jgi:phosphotriesterase-related protein
LVAFDVFRHRLGRDRQGADPAGRCRGDAGPHEHAFIDLAETWFDLPSSAYERSLARKPVSLDIMAYLWRNPLDNEDNARLESVDEFARFRRAGGQTVVDVTPKNVGGDPELVREVARATGLRAVHGTAFYTAPPTHRGWSG